MTDQGPAVRPLLHPRQDLEKRCLPSRMPGVPLRGILTLEDTHSFKY